MHNYKKLFIIITLASLGCTPLTLSNEPVIDFTKYASVYLVPLDGADYTFPEFGDEELDSYMLQEMIDHSGFTLITNDLDETVDTRLFVTIRIEEDLETITSDDTTTTEFEYKATAVYELRSAADAIIDQGSEEYTSDLRRSAIRNALDEIVLRYLPPYRI